MINPNTGVITVADPDADKAAAYRVEVEVSDGVHTVSTSVGVAVTDAPVATDDQLRVATFNASLNRNSQGELISDLSTTGNAQAQAIAEIIQLTQPDVILINEFDFDNSEVAANLFRRNYLEVPQNGADPAYYPYMYVAPSNTGVASGFDLNNNGSIGGGDDAFGFGFFEGQFGMVLFSKYEIDELGVRTFREFLWADMPGALLPDDPTDADGNGDFDNWYTPEELEVVRLSSKSHWDVPIHVNGRVIHALTAHPTPPVFDGPEDRNGTRNHDEIRFWADYIAPGAGNYIYDDQGVAGGLAPGESFVILGDYNSDPFDGDSVPGAAQQLLNNPFVNIALTPTSGPAGGGVENADGGHFGDPQFDTSDFGNPPGNLRVDYALPSQNLTMVDAQVFWPGSGEPEAGLVTASDHRLVFVDLMLTPDSVEVRLDDNGVLVISGTNDDDFIFVEESGGQYVVYSNDTMIAAFDTWSVAIFQIYGFGGNDVLGVDKRIRTDAVISGGDGHDLLLGGRGNDLLIGGRGNDALFGRKGYDTLIGGEGHDYLDRGHHDRGRGRGRGRKDRGDHGCYGLLDLFYLDYDRLLDLFD